MDSIQSKYIKRGKGWNLGPIEAGTTANSTAITEVTKISGFMISSSHPNKKKGGEIVNDTINQSIMI